MLPNSMDPNIPSGGRPLPPIPSKTDNNLKTPKQKEMAEKAKAVLPSTVTPEVGKLPKAKVGPTKQPTKVPRPLPPIPTASGPKALSAPVLNFHEQKGIWKGPAMGGDMANMWWHFKKAKNMYPTEWFDFLNKNPPMQRNLWAYGGSIIGTEWGLKGKFSIGGIKTDFEGSPSRELEHLALAKSVINFFEETAKTVIKDSALAKMPPEDKEAILRSLIASSSYTFGNDEDIKNAYKDYTAGKPITILTGWDNHALEVTLCRGYLSLTNRGDRLIRWDELLNEFMVQPLVLNLSEFFPATGPDFTELAKKLNIKIPDRPPEVAKTPSIENKPVTKKKQKASMKIYKIGSNVDEAFFSKLLSKTTKKEINESKKEVEARKRWFDEELPKELKLASIANVPKSNQKVGNCAWANTKGGFHAELILLHFERNLKSKMPFEEAIQRAIESGTQIFKEWEIWHRSQSLKSLVELQKDVGQPGFILKPKEYDLIIHKVLEKIESKDLDLYTSGDYSRTTAPDSVNKIRSMVQELRNRIAHSH